MRRIDIKTFGLMLGMAALGAAWAIYNLTLAGPLRNDDTVRPLVWAVFAIPAALFLGWLLARRRELGLAAACCFCLYFFSFFVAQRIETLVMPLEQAQASGHSLYFWLMIGIHFGAALGLAVWRARASGGLAPPPGLG